MDAFLYKHNISLSKLVQNAIEERMHQEQKTAVEKEIETHYKRKIVEKRIDHERRKNPKFERELFRAKQLLKEYFTALDTGDLITTEKYKTQMLQDFPEMYVDVIKFEQWKKQNEYLYREMKEQYENVVERLVRIKQKFF